MPTRKTTRKAASRSRRDAISLLKADHRQVASWFSSDEIARMYLNNPCWATVEQELYGGLYEIGELSPAGKSA